LSEIIGHVDARDRPIVSLAVPGQEDGLLVLIDTGFNKELLIHETDAARLKCEVSDVTMQVELAGRERRILSLARTRIVWFGHEREIDVLIARTEQPRATLADEPVALLGTALLSPHKLTVDFATRRVVIAESDE